MLNSLSLKNFRGFEQLEFPKLARVNLIGGLNNAGKTGILEAIYLLLERDRNRLSQLPSLFRAKSDVNDDLYFWRWLAHNGVINGEPVIQGNVETVGHVEVAWIRRDDPRGSRRLIGDEYEVRLDSAERRLIAKALKKGELEFWPKPEVFSPRPSKPVEDAQIYIQAAKKSPDGETRIEFLLKEIDPRLKRVRAFPDEQTNQPLVHVGLDFGEMLPAPQLGQGFNRLLRIYSSLIGADAKVFLIDEIETGLHHSILPTIWKGLAAVAREENVQIFATTHSREAILAAHRVFSQEPSYGFAYHRLEREGRKISAVTYDQEALAGADEANFEVR